MVCDGRTACDKSHRNSGASAFERMVAWLQLAVLVKASLSHLFPGNTRAVPAVLRMVDLALERFPGLFGPGSRAFCFHLMQKLLSLLTLQPAVE